MVDGATAVVGVAQVVGHLYLQYVVSQNGAPAEHYMPVGITAEAAEQSCGLSFDYQ